MKKGVLCGADSKQEWLLPWWWSRYSDHNPFPVTFCDFGMSEEARLWCLERGEVVTIPPVTVKGREEIDPLLAKEWDTCYINPIWELRSVWFSKPSALLHSPYERGIWIDLDCEILAPIAPLFDLCTPQAQIGIMRNFCSTDLAPFDPSILYNGGVIVFEQGAPILRAWAENVPHLNHQFFGDDLLLSHLIYVFRVEVVELPPIYNWRLSQGLNLNAAIVHWIGEGGKSFIKQFGGFKPLLDAFHKDCGIPWI